MPAALTAERDLGLAEPDRVLFPALIRITRQPAAAGQPGDHGRAVPELQHL